MKKRPELVALILFVILTAYAAGLHVFIVPVFQNLLASINASLSVPSRLALTIGRTGVMGVLVFMGLVVLALSRVRQVDSVQQVRALNLASLAVTVFIFLQASLFVDFAKSGGVFSRAVHGQTASATK